MKILIVVVVILALVALTLWLTARRGPNLKADYQQQLKVEMTEA
jgi:uncharacterized membrane protein